MIDAIRNLFWRVMMPRTDSQASGLNDVQRWLMEWMGGRGSTKAGVLVNGKTAMTYATVWQAVNVISGDVSQLPIKLYRRDGEDRSVDREHPSYKLIRRRPHQHISAGTFIQTLQSHALLWGNGYAQINRTNGGKPVSLTPLMPDRTHPVVKDGRLWYETRIGSDRDKSNPSQTKTINPANVLHIKGLGFDGLAGHSVISLARQSWGLGLAGESHGARFFGNYATPQGIVTVPGKMGPEAKEDFRNEWRKLHSADNEHNIAVLSAGTEFHTLTMNAKDAQFLESRKFQRSEVASWFNLPPHKVGDLERATFSNITDQNRDYLERSLMRWLVTWQEELNEKLLTTEEKESDSHFFEFMTEAFLRGNKKERTESQVSQVLTGLASINDIMRQENMNSIGPNGDVRFMPLNITTVDKAIEGPQMPDKNNNPAGDQAPQPDTPANPPPDGTSTQMREKMRAMAVGVLTTLLRAEKQAIVRHAENRKNSFLDMTENFYNNWSPTLTDNIVALGGTKDMADAYIVAGRELCLEVAGKSLMNTLVENAEMAYSNYPAKAESLADHILGSEK